MRRLDGVTDVRLDTVDQYAEVWVKDPTELDFAEFEGAVIDAFYTMVAMYVQARGRVVVHECEDCGRERDFFELDGSGQRFELGKSTLELGDSLLLDAFVQGWDSEHPLLVPTE